MQMRMGSFEDDLKLRLKHWEVIHSTSEWGFNEVLFGNGLGTYSKNYLNTHPQLVKRIGSFSIVNAESGHNLLIGPGEDLMIGQRLTELPNSYKVNFNIDMLAKSDARILIGICERNLLITSLYDMNCTRKWLNIKKSTDYQ